MSIVPPAQLVRGGRSAAEQAFERCEAGDRFHDYVLGEYAPRAPHEGKLRSVSLLLASFACSGVLPEGRALVQHVRETLGPFRTIWGIKHVPESGISGWELYFYDFERTAADLTIARLRQSLSPVLRISAEEPHPLPWHMWSVEVSRSQLLREAEAPIDVYIDMRSYKVHGRRFRFENVYTFHDPRTDIDAVLHRLRSSVHLDERRGDLGVLLHPSLLRCGRVCVANKRSADALYFSRVNTDCARNFVEERGYPGPIVRFFDDNAPDLDHLFWDVGLDFRGDEGPLQITKSSIYGSF